jgi:DNA-binding winged helix-turn-helix (wHTH) protein/predicted ATPase
MRKRRKSAVPSSADGEIPPIRIDPETGWAWRGDQRIEMAPKVFTVLRHLVEHPTRLITREALLAAAWGDAVVSPAAITSCIRDLRRVLDDSSQRPRYIETVHRRGFRFIGPIAPIVRAQWVAPIAPASGTLVGRDAELARLHGLLATASSGQRRLVFVTGEAGIGKTALVEAFLGQIDGASAIRIARGQCVEQYGATEPYLPVLEAIGRLGRAPRGDAVVRTLKRYAPTWLAQLPSLLTDAELDAVQRRAQGTTRQRMLRELIDAFDALSADAPLVLALEDLHWSDTVTAEVLAMLARRRDAARLLIVATYRPAEVAAASHPLKPVKQELQAHGLCEEIALDFLDQDAVREYLDRRFPGAPFSADLARVLLENTSGNPLFLVNVADDLIAQGYVTCDDGQWTLSIPLARVAAGVPETVSQLIEKQIDRLAPLEQAMLAVASVAGAEFSAAVSTVDAIEPRDGERCCDDLARRGHMLRALGAGDWPDGTVAGRFAFVHTLYRNVLYARLPIGHRVALHLRIAERLERAHGDRAVEIAGELAMHFEHGRDIARAVQYRRAAAERALLQHGYREATEHVTRGLALLRELPESLERSRQELALRVVLGGALIVTKGHAGREVEDAYARASELGAIVDDPRRAFPVLLGLGWFYVVRGGSGAARDVGTRLWAMAETTGDPAIRLAAHNALGLVSFYAGEFEAALEHFDRGGALYDPKIHGPAGSAGFHNIVDSGLSCASHAAWALWVLGRPGRATGRMRDALAVSTSIRHPFTLAHAHRFAASFHLCLRDHGAVCEHAEASTAIAIEQGFAPIVAAAGFHTGWVVVEDGREEGIAAMDEWLSVCREIRSEALLPPYLAWMAEAYRKIGRLEDAEALVRDGLALGERTGCGYWAAELHRVKGTLALRSGRTGADDDAESCFETALAIARRQRATSFELRAATSLSQLWQRRRKVEAARRLLSDVYGSFSEGLETPDLVDAKAVLGELSAPR